MNKRKLRLSALIEPSTASAMGNILLLILIPLILMNQVNIQNGFIILLLILGMVFAGYGNGVFIISKLFGLIGMFKK